jgi:hypothetical protein
VCAALATLRGKHVSVPVLAAALSQLPAHLKLSEAACNAIVCATATLAAATFTARQGPQGALVAAPISLASRPRGETANAAQEVSAAQHSTTAAVPQDGHGTAAGMVTLSADKAELEPLLVAVAQLADAAAADFAAAAAAPSAVTPRGLRCLLFEAARQLEPRALESGVHHAAARQLLRDLSSAGVSRMPESQIETILEALYGDDHRDDHRDDELELKSLATSNRMTNGQQERAGSAIPLDALVATLLDAMEQRCVEATCRERLIRWSAGAAQAM